MKLSRMFQFAVCAAAMLVFAGCAPEDQDQNQPEKFVNGAVNDPLNVSGQNGSGSGAWNQGANEGSLAGGNWEIIREVQFPVIYFGYDQDALSAEAQDQLRRVAAYLQKNSTYGLIIEGHCDERGTVEYNRALGERRAQAISSFLGEQGVDVNRFRTMSYGKDKPALQGSGESVWSKNRRGELFLARMK